MGCPLLITLSQQLASEMPRIIENVFNLFHFFPHESKTDSLVRLKVLRVLKETGEKIVEVF